MEDDKTIVDWLDQFNFWLDETMRLIYLGFSLEGECTGLLSVVFQGPLIVVLGTLLRSRCLNAEKSTGLEPELATMMIVEVKEGQQPNIGPHVTVTVVVNGQEVLTIIDMGSPVSMTYIG